MNSFWRRSREGRPTPWRQWVSDERVSRSRPLRPKSRHAKSYRDRRFHNVWERRTAGEARCGAAPGGAPDCRRTGSPNPALTLISFRAHNVRYQTDIGRLIAAIQKELPLTTDPAALQPNLLLVNVLFPQRRAACAAIDRLDQEIAKLAPEPRPAGR
jgi:hypothetical protein